MLATVHRAKNHTDQLFRETLRLQNVVGPVFGTTLEILETMQKDLSEVPTVESPPVEDAGESEDMQLDPPVIQAGDGLGGGLLDYGQAFNGGIPFADFPTVNDELLPVHSPTSDSGFAQGVTEQAFFNSFTPAYTPTLPIVSTMGMSVPPMYDAPNLFLGAASSPMLPQRNTHSSGIVDIAPGHEVELRHMYLLKNRAGHTNLPTYNTGMDSRFDPWAFSDHRVDTYENRPKRRAL